MKNIQITKFPKDLDPVSAFRQKCFEIYGKCPFCGCHEKYTGMTSPKTGIYISRKIAEGFFCNKFYYVYKCFDCGAEWESPSYSMKYLDPDYYLKKGVNEWIYQQKESQ